MTMRRNILQALGFAAVGGLSALVDFGAFWLLDLAGVFAPLASAMSFMAAFGVNYRGNRDLVFRARSARGMLMRYVVLVLVNLALSTGLVAAATALGVPGVPAKIASMIVIAIVNFVVMRMWVFRTPAAAPEPAIAPTT
ncbi:GtrA family protein [Agromyces neolithicus]|uniref:GtrA family protein n=1 Tax=Agromyces neolithicus TaxID=269420 RepID=A0ABN2LYZ1_9MICO